ncbi:MAG: transglutaminase domain-containing protein [Sulfurimonas sp.]|nr:transglutaminase domain-containing protein [Sulfurimonas sp.]
MQILYLKKKEVIKIKKILYLFIISIFILLYFSKVDNSITPEDKKYIGYFLKNIKIIDKNRTFDDELLFIKAVQDTVLNNSYKDREIPKFLTREPKDIFVSKVGICFDRSRVIEKILRNAGFKTRHISIYSTQKTNSAIKSLLTPGISSHAITEVLTSKGWLVVDSNKRWVAIDNEDNILSIKDIFLHVGKNTQIKWIVEAPSIYNKKFTYIYGLYSRHGNFYPPYNFIPDIEWNEFMFNITEIIGLD